MEHDQSQETEQAQDVEMERPDMGEQPQVYGVEKGLTGWRFSRREFVAAAAAAAATATAAAATVVSTRKPGASSSETEEGVENPITLTMAMPAIMVVGLSESIKQVWQLTNNSESNWCRGASLHFVSHKQVQAPALVPVSDIAPGETVDVEVAMMTPAEPGIYQGNWYLNVAGNIAPVSSGQFVLQTGCIAESQHNYGYNTDQTWTVTNPDTNAENTMVHFSQVDLSYYQDSIYIMDGTGNVVQQITSDYPSGVWSRAVPGSVVQVRLVTDGSGNAWGFCLDQVKTAQTVYFPIIIKLPTPTPSPTPCSCYGICTCNPICTCDTVHYWYPN